MRLSSLFIISFLALSICMASVSTASASDWTRGEQVSARIISAQNATGDLTQLSYGIDIKLDKGWKTYWRYPGEAGLAPEMSWDASDNLNAIQIYYPTPKRFTLFDLDNFGYAEHVIFPFTAAPKITGKALDLRLTLNLLVCAEICIPETLTLRHRLPVGIATPSTHAENLAAWLKKIPEQADFNQSGIHITAQDHKAGLDVFFPAGTLPQFDDILITSADDAPFGKPVEMNATHFFLPYKGALYGQETIFDYLTADNTITLLRKDAPAVEMAFTVADLTKPMTTPADKSDMHLAKTMSYYFLIAILGGIILNLMPCVLPVLSLKILSLIGHSTSEQRHIRLGFLASSLGILTGFMILAAVLSALKQAGLAIGWGIQFQNPTFLVLMIVVVLLFALNLWGLFEIPLPRFIARAATKKNMHEPTLFGHFLTGMLAMLLATPCSAPFLGTAVGFALSQGGAAIFVIFLGLGLGLAAPYLLISICPALAHYLPKPGQWMVGLRKVLSLALVITALWLSHVLYRVYTPATLVLSQPENQILWQAFSPEAIEKSVNNGAVVFVDITADWCITCQANKKLTLNSDRVKDYLISKNIVALQGDWTRADQTITAYLQSYQKYGIPFNIVYGPNAPDGIILPELLSQDAIINALQHAGSQSSP